MVSTPNTNTVTARRKTQKGNVMNTNTNYEVVATATKNLELSNVDKARLNEMLTLTDNNDIKVICTSVAKVLSMSNLMDYTLCKAYASIRLALKDEAKLSFKKWCELNDKEVSNTNKYATVWDKFYSDITDSDGLSPRSLFADKGINILEFTPSFLSAFVSKNTVDVVALFTASGVTSNVTCKVGRELAKCIRTSKLGVPVLDTNIAIALVNGDITKHEDYGKNDDKKNDKKNDDKKNDDKKNDDKKNDEKKNDNTKHIKMSKDMISFIDKVCKGLNKEVETSTIVITLKDGTTVVFEK